MAEISVVGPEAGEPTLSGPASVRIIEDGSTTSGRLGMAEIVVAPHAAGPPQHRHRQHDEGFYVVSGTARFTSGEKSFDAPARTLVIVPPGAPHTFANPGDDRPSCSTPSPRTCTCSTSATCATWPLDGQPPSPPQIAEVMARYATEPAG